MSKSSSGGNDGSRSSSVEYEEPNQQPMNIQALMNTTSGLETSGTTEENALSVKNEPLVPNSPPPSYEHVLEEVMRRHIIIIIIVINYRQSRQ